jgi:hypothetical protein
LQLINKGDLMKYLTTSVISSILILSACDSETDIFQKSIDSNKQGEITSGVPLAQDSVIIDSENTTKQNDIQEQQEPFVLSDFRNAIDSVVHDSIQEEVEEAVEHAIAKQTNK